jgi:hypothetical protein
MYIYIYIYIIYIYVYIVEEGCETDFVETFFKKPNLSLVCKKVARNPRVMNL